MQHPSTVCYSGVMQGVAEEDAEWQNVSTWDLGWFGTCIPVACTAHGVFPLADGADCHAFFTSAELAAVLRDARARSSHMEGARGM